MGPVKRRERKGAVYYVQFNAREAGGKLYGKRKRRKAVPDKL
jgi:hypothetical protein